MQQDKYMDNTNLRNNSFQIRTADSTYRILFFILPKLQNKNQNADKTVTFSSYYFVRIGYGL